MLRQDTPYEYGDEVPGVALSEEASGESERVIVDGAVMSYRSYRRRGERLAGD
jgi:hypothetical protein